MNINKRITKLGCLVLALGVGVCGLFFCTYALAATQIQTETIDLPYSEVENGSDMMATYNSENTLALPGFNKDEEQDIIERIGDNTRFYVSIPRSVEPRQNNWEEVGQKNGYSIWQLHIHSPEALGLQVDFSEVDIPSEMSVKVYGKEYEMPYISEYTANKLDAAKDFSSLLIPGDTIVVEVWIPSDSNKTPTTNPPPFKIERIHHQFRDSKDNVRGVANLYQRQSHSNCPIENVRCDFGNTEIQPWRSVGRIVVGGVQCSGTLIANGRGENTLYLFLTAYHCVSRVVGAEASRGTRVSASFIFGQSSCAAPNSSIGAASGARFIAANEQGDYALLHIPIANIVGVQGERVVLLGLNAFQLNGGTLDMLHHSEGAPQNYVRSEIRGITYADGARDQNSISLFSSCRGPNCTHYSLHSIIGGTSGGSSGGGWFRQAGRGYSLFAVQTNGDRDTCTQQASLFSKIFEDDRVRCAVTEGQAYVSDGNVANGGRCLDRGRPLYSLDPNARRPDTNTSVSSGGGGATNTSTLLILMLVAGCALILRRRKFTS